MDFTMGDVTTSALQGDLLARLRVTYGHRGDHMTSVPLPVMDATMQYQ